MAADVVRLERVSKRYRVWVERSNLRMALPWLPHDPTGTGKIITAVDDFSLTVEEGEALGIIGDNGVGKSTVLKLIAGVVAPTEGRVATRGRVASIIELGVGFHDDLTGLENLEFAGVLMGMTRAEMRRRRDDIVDFSGIGDAIDTPVKRYSSGMLARLGFALATHVDADIILVDEVLSVGDIDYQRLSLERLAELNDEGVTTVLVSHNLAAILHLCTRVLQLDEGHVVADDEPETVVVDYAGSLAAIMAGVGRIPVRLTSLVVEPAVLEPAKPFTIEATVEVDRPMPRGQLQLALRLTPEFIEAAGHEIDHLDFEAATITKVPVPSDLLSQPGVWTIRGTVDGYPMFPGSYAVDLELHEPPHNAALDLVRFEVLVPGATEEHEPLALPVSWQEPECDRS